MTLPKGWINRQYARVERDAQNWPDWMRREMEIRAKEQTASDPKTSTKENEMGAPATKKAGCE